MTASVEQPSRPAGATNRDDLLPRQIAAPIALKSHGIALGKRITSYPSMKERLAADYQVLCRIPHKRLFN